MTKSPKSKRKDKKMKIIKYGKKPEEVEYVKKCPNCGTVFVYQENESTYELDMDGNVDHLVKCPFCDYNMPVGLFKKIYNPDKHGIVVQIEEKKRRNQRKTKARFQKGDRR